MDETNLAYEFETDNVQWPNSHDILRIPNEFDLNSSEDDKDTHSTVSVNDGQDVTKETQFETKIEQLNLNGCTKVHIGNQAYYQGEVTIQQYVVNSKDGVKVLPAQSEIIKKSFCIDGSDQNICASKDRSNIESVSKPLKCMYLWGIFLIIILLVVGVTVPLIIFYFPTNESDDITSSSNYTDRLVTRGNWMALPEKSGVQKFPKQPLNLVMVGHTAGSSCHLTATCSSLVRTLQADAFSRGWSDISYNFLVGGDGYIFEGRGWDNVGSHTITYNNKSIGVAFIGNFASDLPPKRQLTAFSILLNEGVAIGKLTANYKMLFQKQVKSTESPGAALIVELMKWYHWLPNVPSKTSIQ